MNSNIIFIVKSVICSLLLFLFLALLQFYSAFLEMDKSKSFSIEYKDFIFLINDHKVSTILSFQGMPFFVIITLLFFFYFKKIAQNQNKI